MWPASFYPTGTLCWCGVCRTACSGYRRASQPYSVVSAGSDWIVDFMDLRERAITIVRAASASGVHWLTFFDRLIGVRGRILQLEVWRWQFG